MHSIFQAIKMRFYYLENCNLMLVPIILGGFIFVWYKILSFNAKLNYIRTKNLVQKDRFFSLGRKATLIYDRFIFSYALAPFYLTIFQLLIYAWSDLSDKNHADPLYVAISFGLSLVVLFSIFFISCSQTIEGFKCYFDGLNNKENHISEEKALKDRYNKDYHPLYVPFYLFYQIFLFVLMASTFLEFEYLTQVMMIGILLYTIIVWCWKPYTLSIHNFFNTFNQVVVLLFLTVSILGKYNLLNHTLKLISLYATIILIVVALVLQLIRVYLYKKSFKREFKVEKNEIKKNCEQTKFVKYNNQFLYQNQIAKQVHDKGLKIDIEELIGQYDRSSILGRHELNQKLREVSIMIEKIDQKGVNMEEGQNWIIKDNLKKLKERLKRGLTSHSDWIFR